MLSIQREFGQIYSGKNLIANNFSNPNNAEETQRVRNGIRGLLEGSLLIYLLAMWETHMPDNIHEWLTIEEKQNLNAYKHVRDCVANDYKGGRAKKHKNKVKAFEQEMPFSNITWNKEHDSIDISSSSVSYDFYNFMEYLMKQLVVRFYKNEKPTA